MTNNNVASRPRPLATEMKPYRFTTGSVRWREIALRTVGTKFGRHGAFRPAAEPDLNHLARAKFGEAEAAKCFHVNEDVRSTIATCQEPEPTDSIEPLHHGPLPTAFGLHHDVGALRQLGRMDRGALVHAEDAKRLQTFRPAKHFTMHPGAFVGNLIATSAEARYVEENVGQTIIGYYETIALAGIEPLDGSCSLEDI